MNSEYSKDDYLTALNKGLRQSAVDTVLTGAGSHTATGGATAVSDITDPDNYDSLKFAIKLDAGDPYQNIDIRQRLNSTALTTSGVPTYDEVADAIEAELRSVFADENESLSVAYTANAFVITDAEGRSIEVFQGAGDGFLFGTDDDNSGSLAVDSTIQNNISAAWDGSTIVLTNAAGGDITVDNISYTGSSIIFDAAEGQESQVDPIYYASTNYSNISSSDGNEVRFEGVAEESSMTLVFSNRVGDPGGTAAQYGFKITNAAGVVYADLTDTAALDVHEDVSEADIIAAVKAALSAGIAANMSADDTITLSEFDISFSNGSLSITNTAGRALAVQEFSSEVGTMTVVPSNELGGSETLASQSGLFSTTRVSVNSAFFGMTASPTAAGDLLFTLNGMTIGGTTAGEGVVLDMTAGYANGAALAAAIETAIHGVTQDTIFLNGTEVTAGVDLSTISVDWDADSGELILSDTLGRAIGFGLREGNTFVGSGMIFGEEFVQGIANDKNIVKVTSSTVKGDLYEATKVTMTLNTTSEATFDFKINGQLLGSTTYNPSAAFAGSDLESALDDLMVTLNGPHGSDVFEYSVSGAQITVWQRDGGPVEVSDFATSGVGDDALTLTISGADGQGDTVVAYEVDATASTAAATASGVLAERTEATLTLSSDDVYSMVINNGVADYSLSSKVVDLDDTTSVQNFVAALETALDGSGISASMDMSGKVYFVRGDGGEIGLKSFTSGAGNAGTWTPKSGQGDSASLDGTGSLTSTVTSSTSSTAGSTTVSTGGTVAVSQISVATQEDAEAALDVLDDALSYVNGERSKLGAIENRLTHTIDNLTNVITNTQASRSRIVDADYAAETSELARTQIIQQAATAMLAQANQSSQSVLSLLQ
jgi:flagellin